MSDPYRNDQSRRDDADRTGFWTRLTAALTALGFLIGGAIGYNWGWGAHKQRARSSPRSTTDWVRPHRSSGQHLNLGLAPAAIGHPPSSTSQ